MNSKSPVAYRLGEYSPDRGAADSPPEPPDTDTMPAVDSQTILGGRTEVIIRHRDQLYRLRQTKAGRLLLNK